MSTAVEEDQLTVNTKLIVDEIENSLGQKIITSGHLDTENPIEIGNIKIGDPLNQIISTNTDGNISILPNGSGEVLVKADPVSNLGVVTKQYADSLIITGTPPRYLDIYHTNPITLSGTFADIPLNIERIKDTTAFTHTANSSEVTFAEAGTYIVEAIVTTTITSGTDRSQSESKLQINTGLGYSDIPGTKMGMYNRRVMYGDSTGVAKCIITVTIGTKVKIQARKISGTSVVTTLDEGCSLTAIKFAS